MITLEDDFLKGISLSIKKFDVVKRVKYTYKKCINDKCKDLINIVNVNPLNNRQDNYLVNITGTYENSNNNHNYDSLVKLISSNGMIEYTLDDVTQYAEFTNVTPDTYTEGVILETVNGVNKASSIKLIISTRNNKYVIRIK